MVWPKIPFYESGQEEIGPGLLPTQMCGVDNFLSNITIFLFIILLLFLLKGERVELDGVGPVDNRSSTIGFTTLSRNKRKKLWHMTHDMWHVTCYFQHMTHDMWHVTHDILPVVCCGWWTFCQNFSSLAFTVCDLWYFEDLEEKADWLIHWQTESINNKGFCRPDPATPGLLTRRGKPCW